MVWPCFHCMRPLAQRAELISRTPDPDDRRSALIRITPSGRRIVDRGVELLADHKNEAFADLSERQRELLENMLDQLIESADNVTRTVDAV